MKTLIFGFGIGLYSCLTVYSQEVKIVLNSSNNPEVLGTFVARDVLPESHTNPDVEAGNPLPNITWLQNFSTLLMRNIAYPTRGKAYHITGKMLVKIGIDAKGKVKAIAFEQSLGRDFEQAIMDALAQIPRSKIKPFALPLVGYIHFSLPIHFKE